MSCKLENPRENPTMDQFLKFIEYRFQPLESIGKCSLSRKLRKLSLLQRFTQIICM